LIAVETTLGPDVLLLRSFSGTEGMSQLFHYHLDMLSEEFSIDFDQIVGQNATIGIKLDEAGSFRYINGFVSRFSQLPVEGHLARYEAVVVPWLWFLTRTSDCRIYQDKSVPEIIEDVFNRFGFSDFENQLQGSYGPRKYCVQYRETAANFVMRLMEEEGIFFFFRHENGRHILVMGDRPSVHRPCPNQARARYEHSLGRGADPGQDVVHQWRHEQELRPGKYGLNDFNFETPYTSLLSNVESKIDQGGNKRYEVYDYPGEYLKRDRGDTLVGVRMEEEEAPHIVNTGGGDCRAFATGFRFELTEHDRRDQNGQYVLTSISHSAHSGSFIGGGGGEGATYSNTFTCIPFDVPFRPPRSTPKPLVEGCQTALVVGPAGEEIYVDKYGRIKVQFHWDRIGQRNEKSSCWIRVSQDWAGKKWGAVFLPRIGQEVVVDFLEGDPDRPLITGRVYNADQMPPYTLPANSTMSTFKSMSSKGGGGFNEIRFEDKKGQEQIFIHAQKNQDVRVKNSRFETIGADSHLEVLRDQFEIVKGNKHLTVNGDLNEKVDGKASLKVGMDQAEDVGGKYSLKAGTEIYLSANLSIVLEASTNITLKVGGNSIALNPAGIFIQGTMVNINSGSGATSGSAGAVKTPEEPKSAATGQPGEKTKLPPPPPPPPPPAAFSPAAAVMNQAARSGTPFTESGQ
jgi:type VI secretion system secreted protein VgrG